MQDTPGSRLEIMQRDCPTCGSTLEPAMGSVDDDGNAIETMYWCPICMAYVTYNADGERIPNYSGDKEV